jgi:hypothetical protein
MLRPGRQSQAKNRKPAELKTAASWVGLVIRSASDMRLLGSEGFTALKRGDARRRAATRGARDLLTRVVQVGAANAAVSFPMAVAHR